MRVRQLLSEKDSTRDFETDKLGAEVYDPELTMTISYRSTHPFGGNAHASWGIDSVRLKTQAKHVDEQGDVIRTYPIGFDVTKMPGWSEDVLAFYEDKLAADFSKD